MKLGDKKATKIEEQVEEILDDVAQTTNEELENNNEQSKAGIESEQTENKEDALSFEVLQKLQEENAELKADYLRACANVENIKKRHLQEMDKNSKYAVASFAKELLAVADNLHRALSAYGEENGNAQLEQLIKGVDLTESELMRVFAKFGITKMDVMGKPFDPSFHQVIQALEDANKTSGEVVAELQSGYMINDRILREAMVVVVK